MEYSQIVSIKSLDVSFKVLYEDSLYGSEFWNNVELGLFEPDVLFTLKRQISSRVVFFDVGAATGVMTLIAASLGATCIAYEPISKFFNNLESNMNLNSHLSNMVTSKQSIVSTKSKGLSYIRDGIGLSISSIVYPDYGDDTSDTVDIKNEIKNYCRELQPILKFDIEGAEYLILQDTEFLELLRSKKAILILAIHPGFFRPIRNHQNYLLKFFKKIKFVGKNYIDNFKLYNKLKKYCKIYRTNENEVKSVHKFCFLAAAGVYEFNLYF